MSKDAKQNILSQGNVEAFERLKTPDKTQCEHYHKYVTATHVYCHCGTCGQVRHSRPRDPEISQTSDDDTVRHAQDLGDYLEEGTGKRPSSWNCPRTNRFPQTKRNQKKTRQVDFGQEIRRVSRTNWLTPQTIKGSDAPTRVDKSNIASRGKIRPALGNEAMCWRPQYCEN